MVLLCTNMHKNQIHIKFYTKSVKEFMAYIYGKVQLWSHVTYSYYEII